MVREHEKLRYHRQQQQQQQQQRLFSQKPYPDQLATSELECHSQVINEYYKEFSISAFEQADNHKPDSTLIKQQPQLTSDYRSPLLDFLFKMSKRTRVCPNVYYRSVKLIDRYCSKRIVLLEQAQLVATTCLWLVAKTDGGCNHCYPSTGGRFDGPTMRARIPRLSELCQLCGPSCSYDEGMFVQMERHILDTLNWQVTEPGIDEWCFNVQEYNTLSPNVSTKAKESVLIKQFIIDTSLYGHDLISTHPAELASSIIDVFNTIRARLSPTLLLLSQQQPQQPSTRLVLPTTNIDITEKLLNCITKSTETIITNYSQLTSSELIKNFIQESHYYLTSIQKSKIRSLSASSSISTTSSTSNYNNNNYYDSEEDLSDNDSLFEHIVNHSMNFSGSRTPSPMPSPDKLVFNKLAKQQQQQQQMSTNSPLSRETHAANNTTMRNCYV